MEPTAPPPQRTAAANAQPAREMKEKGKWSKMGESVFNKTVAVSDWFAGYANSGSNSTCSLLIQCSAASGFGLRRTTFR